MRWGLGPVFVYECLANSRRWQNYAVRALGVAVMLGAITSIASSRGTIGGVHSWRDYAALGESYFDAIIGVELTLVMLAAPAATAGAICVDRARGTLAHMLMTDLSDPEIVLGKLAARLLPVLGLVAGSWPVLAVSSLLGGIDPTALTLAFAIIVAVALLGCSMALALSVWARRPHEVVLVVYAFWMLLLLLRPVWWGLSTVTSVGRPPEWSLLASPYDAAFAPYSAPGRAGLADYLGFFGSVLGASAAMAGLAVWRMRPVARQGIDRPRKERRLGPVGRALRALPGPSLDGNPVLWREWHRGRPSRWVAALVVLLGGSSSIACVIGAGLAWTFGLGPGPPAPGLVVGTYGSVILLVFGLLMLSVAAPTSMAEERQRGSLDLLAATSLSTPAIVIGKWLGALRPVAPLAIGPGLLGLALATAEMHDPAPSTAVMRPAVPAPTVSLSTGERLLGAGLIIATVLVHGALIASVGVATATWISRQSRAIAASVGSAVIVGAGWPMLLAAGRIGPREQGLLCLSPVVAVLEIAQHLGMRYPMGRSILWWTAFWDVECLVLALGILWLTARTFDGCLGRIPERPVRRSAASDVALILAWLVGVGGVFGAIGIVVAGGRDFFSQAETGVVVGLLWVVAGLMLATVPVVSSMSPGVAGREAAPWPAAPIVGRIRFAIGGWESFRLVLLLSIGPALMALAAAAVQPPVRVGMWVRVLPGGAMIQYETDPSGTTYIHTTGNGPDRIREATEDEIAAAGLDPPGRVRVRAMALAGHAALAIPARGAAFVGVGALLGLWIGRCGWAIAAIAGLALFATIVWPIGYILLFARLPGSDWGPALASVFPAYCSPMFRIDRPAMVDAMTAWAGLWNLIMIVVGVCASALAVHALDRRAPGAGEDEGDGDGGTAARLGQPVAGRSGRASIWGRVASK